MLADEHWWLWSVETLREAVRLLVALAPKLHEAELAELEQTILAGPPRQMYRPDIEPEHWTLIRDSGVWLRLSKAADSGTTLGAAASSRLRELSELYPDWQLSENERDEFSTWMGDGSEWRPSDTTPRDLHELIDWLKQNQDTDPWHEDDWHDRCRDDFDTAASALSALARRNIWPTRRWREALQTWSEDELIERSWCTIASVLAAVPDAALQNFDHGVSTWLQKTAKNLDGQEQTFFGLCERILALNYEDDDDADDMVGRAINHPVGKVTEALLQWWYRNSLEDGQSLAEELRPRFTELCDTQIPKFRHARVLLAAHVITLFRVDRDWTTEHLLPLFDWQHSQLEARSAWEGFLWSPQLYRPLFEVLKPAFLDTAHYYEKLGTHSEQYASLLTFSALDPSDVFTKAELVAATRALPLDGLQKAASALAHAIEGAGDQRTLYWENRARPYLREIWPQTRDNASPSIAESFGRVCIAAQDAFPRAVEFLRPWLQPLTSPGWLVRSLHKAGFCERFPESALELLGLVIGDQTQWVPEELGACLLAIRRAEPKLNDDHAFVKLRMYLEQHGRGLC